MTIHHLNCGTLNPRFPRNTQSILYCLLVETRHGLLLVDTGFGVDDCTRPTPFIRTFMSMLGMQPRVEETALGRVRALGYDAADVKHIVLTHMHCDHTGGLRDFSGATVHVYEDEYKEALHPHGVFRRFYEPAHWSHSPDWCIHSAADASDWYGFDSLRIDAMEDSDIRLVLLPGHTRGHCGVAIAEGDGWLLHAGDAAYPFYTADDPLPPFKPLPGYVRKPPRLLEQLLIGEQTARLRALLEVEGARVQIICSNDSVTWSRMRDGMDTGAGARESAAL